MPGLPTTRGYFYDEEVPNNESEKLQNRLSIPPKRMAGNFDVDMIQNIASERAEMRR